MDFGIFTMVSTWVLVHPRPTTMEPFFFFSESYQIILPFPLKVAMVLMVLIFTIGRGSFYLGS
jgi:hypothetical protein